MYQERDETPRRKRKDSDRGLQDTIYLFHHPLFLILATGQTQTLRLLVDINAMKKKVLRTIGNDAKDRSDVKGVVAQTKPKPEDLSEREKGCE